VSLHRSPKPSSWIKKVGKGGRGRRKVARRKGEFKGKDGAGKGRKERGEVWDSA